MSGPLRCIVMGAAGRDFHDFLVFLRRREEFRVVAFTATQIPFIERRVFPAELAGERYEEDIPIHPEGELPRLIDEFDVDVVFLAYSDLSHADVMHRQSLVQSCGACFAILGPKQTQLRCRLPVVSVTGVRTGVGKSPLTQRLAAFLRDRGRKVAVVRHPMPYGDLAAQAVQRFASVEDLDDSHCTLEEREEFEPYVQQGQVVFAGVDYERIVAAAEDECDVLLWDGGNNDYPFVKPDLSIVVADALRAGHEIGYFPGETNFRSADVIVVNKVEPARADDVWLIRSHAHRYNRDAAIVESTLAVTVDDPSAIRGRKAIVVEDGPTVTHGGMPYGAGLLAAREHGASEIVDPRRFAVGSIVDAYHACPQVKQVLPALGYSDEQLEELRQTIDASDAEVVVDGSPAALEQRIELRQPVVRVRYAFQQLAGPAIEELVEQAVSRAAE